MSSRLLCLALTAVLFQFAESVDAEDTLPVSGVLKTWEGEFPGVVPFDVYVWSGAEGLSGMYGLPAEWQLTSSGQTDSDGKYGVELARQRNCHAILFRPANGPTILGRVNLRTTIDPPPISTTSDHNTIPNKLGRSAQIVVRVIDTKSQPILGARVSRSHLDRSVLTQQTDLIPPGSPASQEFGETDITGEVQIRIDRDHMNSIRVNHPQYLVGEFILQRDPLEDPVIRLQANPIDRRSIQEGKTYEIVLHPALTIEGQVLSGDGEPVAGADVAVAASEEFAKRNERLRDMPAGVVAEMRHLTKTDAAGRFRVPHLTQEDWSIIAHSPGQFGFRSVKKQEGSMVNVSLTLKKAKRLHGRLTDRDNSESILVPHGKILSVTPLEVPLQAPVRDDGTFEFDYPYDATPLVYLSRNPYVESISLVQRVSQERRTVDGELRIPVRKLDQRLRRPDADKALPNFPLEYSLTAGQVVLRKTRPFSPARQAFFQLGDLSNDLSPEWIDKGTIQLLRQTTSDAALPFSGLWVQDDKGRFHFRDELNRPGDLIWAIHPQNIQSRYGTSNDNVPWGDFVLRQDAEIPELVAALNSAFQQPPRIPYSLRIEEKLFETIHLNGTLPSEDRDTTRTIRLVPANYQGNTRSYRFRRWGEFTQSLAVHLSRGTPAMKVRSSISSNTEGSWELIFVAPEPDSPGSRQYQEQIRLRAANFEELRSVASQTLAKWGIELSVSDTIWQMVQIDSLQDQSENKK